MSKAKRVFQLAQEVAASYDLLKARRAGSGVSYTREIMDHLTSRVIEVLGPGVAHSCPNRAYRQSADFWIKGEQTFIEVEYSMRGSDLSLETGVFKALLAKDGGQDVGHLILIGGPESVQRWQAPTTQSVMDWVKRHHHIEVQLWELNEDREGGSGEEGPR